MTIRRACIDGIIKKRMRRRGFFESCVVYHAHNCDAHVYFLHVVQTVAKEKHYRQRKAYRAPK